MREEEQVNHLNVQVVSADGGRANEELYLLREHALTVRNGEEILFEATCVNMDLREFVVGKLLTDGYITELNDLKHLIFNEDGTVATVEIKKASAEQTPFRALQITQTIWEEAFSLAKAFMQETNLHALTQAVHCCMLAADGEVVYLAEDIGRHNCMDKVIGYMLLNHLDPVKCMVYTSGRTPKDMVQKAILARIPVLVSKSVATTDAVELANEAGLILINRAWPDRAYLMTEIAEKD